MNPLSFHSGRKETVDVKELNASQCCLQEEAAESVSRCVCTSVVFRYDASNPEMIYQYRWRIYMENKQVAHSHQSFIHTHITLMNIGQGAQII